MSATSAITYAVIDGAVTVDYWATKAQAEAHFMDRRRDTEFAAFIAWRPETETPVIDVLIGEEFSPHVELAKSFILRNLA